MHKPTPTPGAGVDVNRRERRAAKARERKQSPSGGAPAQVPAAQAASVATAMQQGFGRYGARDLAGAATAFRQVLTFEPGHPAALHNLGLVLCELERYDEGVSAYRELIALQPGNADARVNLGAALQSLARFEQAEAVYREAIRLAPSHADAWRNLGHLLEMRGDADGAEQAYRKTLALAPGVHETWYSLAQCRRFTAADDADLRALEELATRRLEPYDNACIAFALGKLRDDMDCCREAADAFDTANRIMRSSTRFDAVQSAARVERIVETFDARYFTKTGQGDTHCERPVFIIGLPRAGKSLLEGLLCRDPRIGGVDELTRIAQLGDALPGGFPAGAVGLQRRTAIKAAEDYLGILDAALPPACQRALNTLPANVYYLGLIAGLFARARIIHCTRDPLDTCFAIYRKLFTRGGHEYAYELDDVAQYYLQYQRLVEHWKEVLPLPIHEVDYQQLVTQPGQTAERVLEFLGLSASETDFAAIELDTRELNRARAYLDYLEPLRARLDQAGA